jgi:GT2 family glycosyltransferase
MDALPALQSPVTGFIDRPQPVVGFIDRLQPVVGFIDRLQPDMVAGWIHDPSQPQRPVSFRLVIDDIDEHFEIASIFRADVIGGGYASAHVGFAVPIPPQFQDRRPHRLAFFRDDGSALSLCDPKTQISSHLWTIGAEAVPLPEAASRTRVVVDRLSDGSISGWAYDDDDHNGTAMLKMAIDGELIEIFQCAGPREDVRNAGHPHALVGFTRKIPGRFCDDQTHALTLLSGDDRPASSLSGAIAPSLFFQFPSIAISGRVDGLHDGAIRGWVIRHDHIANRRSGGVEVLVTHLGQPIGQMRADQFRADVAETLDCDPNCGFTFMPAISYAAGRSLDLRFRVLPDGPELEGSPFLAQFPDQQTTRALSDLLGVADRLFTQMWDLRARIKSLLPSDQHNLQTYDNWARIYQASLAQRLLPALATRPLVSIICPTYRPRMKDFTAAVQSVIDQTYRHWELIIVDDCSNSPDLSATIRAMADRDCRIRAIFLETNSGISGATNAAIAEAAGDYVAFFDHDDLLVPRAIEMMLGAAQRTGAELLYCDEDKIDDAGEFSEINFKPDWNHRLLMAQNYVCHLLFVRRAMLLQAGPLRTACDGAQDHDLILRLVEIIPPDRIHHVAEILYHWRKTPTSTASSGKSKSYAVQAGIRAVSDHLARRGLDAVVSSPREATFYAIDWVIAVEPKVSIIIPYREHIDLTRACITAVRGITAYRNYEIVLVDNWSISASSQEFAAEIAGLDDIKIIRAEIPFNYSELNNMAVRATSGDFVLFLNNDVFVQQANWLAQMVGEAMAAPDIALVGAKLFYPNDLVQHAGVILGVGGIADHAFRGLSRDEPGYMARAICSQELSAVTAACLLCRRAAFKEVGGFDAANLHVAFNDVDLCLKIGAAGHRIVWAANVEAEHRESLSRGSDFKPEHQARFFHENAFMQDKWRDVLANDRHYSRFFSRRSGLFKELIEPDLKERGQTISGTCWDECTGCAGNFGTRHSGRRRGASGGSGFGSGARGPSPGQAPRGGRRRRISSRTAKASGIPNVIVPLNSTCHFASMLDLLPEMITQRELCLFQDKPLEWSDSR